MKNLLFIFALLLMFTETLQAQEVKESTIENRVGEPTFLTGIEIDMRNVVSYPYEATVGISSGTVLNISGPTNPNMEWIMGANHMITIYFYENDLAILEPGVIARIEITTTDACYYVEVKGKF